MMKIILYQNDVNSDGNSFTMTNGLTLTGIILEGQKRVSRKGKKSERKNFKKEGKKKNKKEKKSRGKEKKEKSTQEKGETKKKKRCWVKRLKKEMINDATLKRKEKKK